MIYWLTTFILLVCTHGFSFENSISRRRFIFGTGIASVVISIAQYEAEASYSAYANREKDWEERKRNGEIKISTPDDLRRQIRAIIPNDERSKIFCPNGSSSNVTPLMENKCSDRLAAPSVFGRSNDAVGNSIPGFQGTYKSTAGSDSSLLDNVGGFPTYYKK